MGWRRIAFIFEESDAFQTHMKEFRWILEAHGINVVVSEGVKDINDLDVHLQNLKRQDVRIIYIGFYLIETLKLYCQAYLAGMTTSKYVWIAPYWAGYGTWWVHPPPSSILPCTKEQIVDAVNSCLHFRGRQRQANLTDLDYNGVKPLPEHYDYFNRNQLVSDIARTYDNILVIALALNASIADLQHLRPPRRLEDFRYSDSDMARVILENADNINFVGLQGPVLIKNGQQNRDIVEIAQAQREELNEVMIYRTEGQSLETSDVSKLKWKGGHIPVDGITTRTVILQVPPTIRATLFTIASIGAVIALAFLFLNVRYKHKRAIKMSSPSLGNLTIIGCLLLHASVIAMGLDTTQLSVTTIVIKCHLERVLISLGVSCAFGSIFMKTYRIHAIFTAIKRFKRIDLPDWKLISGVLVIVLTDCVIFAVWIALETTSVYTLTLEPRLDMTEPEKEIFDVPEIRYCSSKHDVYFIAALYGVKGVLLTFGLFLAWETRNIAVSRLSDSKSIAASVYIVALTIVLTVPTVAVLDEEVKMTYLLPGVVIVVVSTFVLCLNFVPKVYLLLTMHEEDITLSMMQSMGYGGSTTTNSHLPSSTDVISSVERLHVKLTKKQAVLKQLLKELHLLCFARTDEGAVKNLLKDQSRT
ncbi:gamma-aminobutyric acid type B receptor subunit 2-like [Patiria miniata]|uniref:G-protein coupled receptors family 3 profile domain-containing protein n=1 Tax=Patiria miniata TaxID=46514 RepID=A0A914B7E1_PATMI|nr:gamma-aminobutyric acid type B receptor subunit 2-like [Patiria miniata]